MFATVLSFFSSGKTLSLVAIATTIIVSFTILYVMYIMNKSELDTLRVSYSKLEDAHFETIKTFQLVKLDIQLSNDALANERQRRVAIDLIFKSIRERIANVKNDGCVGPAVLAVVNGLRDSEAHSKNKIRSYNDKPGTVTMPKITNTTVKLN